MSHLLKSDDQTRAFGEWLARKLKAGDVISLEGPLGAGKTTLMQGLVAGLGIQKKITSPTFILFRVLPVESSRANFKWLVHGDAYRIKKPEEMVAAGLEDYLSDPDTVTIIEWGNKISGILPERVKVVRLKIDGNMRLVDYPIEYGSVPVKLA